MSARYAAPEQVPVCTWIRQGSIYDSVFSAKYAAAKLWSSCNNFGVVVKKVSGGWGLFFWR